MRYAIFVSWLHQIRISVKYQQFSKNTPALILVVVYEETLQIDDVQ